LTGETPKAKSVSAQRTASSKSEFSPEDELAITKFKERQRNRPPIQEVSPKGLGLEGFDVARAGNALGSGDPFFVIGLCNQLLHSRSASNPFLADRLNFMLSIVNGIEPRDATEALLASQMAAVHCALMECIRHMNAANTRDHRQEEQNAMMRLSRVFSMQLETLKRYRSTGEQRIQVQHINVNADKAVVGVSQGDGAGSENGNQPHGQDEAGTRSAPLLSHIKTNRLTLPLAGCEGLERVPLPRGTFGSPQR
jgi:hypothetical protein